MALEYAGPLAVNGTLFVQALALHGHTNECPFITAFSFAVSRGDRDSHADV
jgi:hypothetical protein